MTVPIRIVHDTAHVTTLTVLECIENCIRPEEKDTAYHELYRIIHAGLETAFIFYNRERLRLFPLTPNGEAQQN